MVAWTERARAYARDHMPTTSRHLDQYLTEHLPQLIREHELATEERIRPIDEQLGRHHDTLVQLETWQGTSTQRLELIKRRIGRLEVKYGLGAH